MIQLALSNLFRMARAVTLSSLLVQTLSSLVVQCLMPSPLDLAKRELVKVLKALARKYAVQLTLERENSDKQVTQAYRRLSLKVHPDKGGDQADSHRV